MIKLLESHFDLSRLLWDHILQHRDEGLLNYTLHQGAILIDIKHLNLFLGASRGALGMHYSLLEGAGLIGRAEEAMLGEVGEVDQVDGLAVSYDEEWESAEVEAWHQDKVRALSLILQRTLHLDQSAPTLVKDAHPWHVPYTYRKYVWRDFVDLCHQVVCQEEVI